MTQLSDEVVERVAIALCRSVGESWPTYADMELRERAQEHWVRLAGVALESSGHAKLVEALIEAREIIHHGWYPDLTGKIDTLLAKAKGEV